MSRVIVFGSEGFIGRHVVDELSLRGHEVYSVSRRYADDEYRLTADLLDKEQVKSAIDRVVPHFVINCAGIVDPSQNVENNTTFTRNILEAAASTPELSSVIISGSAAVYGNLASITELPVSENTPLRASQGYALAKLHEESESVALAEKLGIKAITLRIFNPIGPGMADKFLIPKLLDQVQNYEQGRVDAIELSRLDSERDYVSVRDVARAFGAVIEGSPSFDVYNVGSGVGTSNGELLELVVKSSKMEDRPRIVETQDKSEMPLASCADITRAKVDLGWEPIDSLEETIERIVNEKAD